MSKSIKINFNTLFLILLAVMSLNACQKRIATTNGQILYDPNEEEYSYVGQTSGVQNSQQYQQDEKSKKYQRQQQEILDLYNKNQNVNPDSSKNIDENYYYAGQTSSNTNNDKKNNQNQPNSTNVVAPVILNNSKDQKTTSAIDKLNQPTKSSDGKYTYVPNAQKAGIKNTNADNVITDRELNDKLYGSMDGRFKKSKLEKVNKQNGLYSNKEELLSGKTGSSSSSASNSSSLGSSSKSSSFGSSSKSSSFGSSSKSSSFGNSSSSGNSASSGSSGASTGLSSADKASLGTSIGTGSASLGASVASLATSLTGNGTDVLGTSGSKVGDALSGGDKSLEQGKDTAQNAQDKAKEQQKKDDKNKKQNKQLYIQAGRYNNAQWAQKVLKKLKKGYPTATSRVEGAQTVLLVGPYPNKMVAQAVKSKLISEGFTGAFFTNK